MRMLPWVALSALLLLPTAFLLTACGKTAGHAQVALNGAAMRSTADLSGGGGDTGILHVPATWQDTRGFTPYVDYRPDQILAVFSDELSPQAQNAPPGMSLAPYNPSSVIIKSPAHAQFARSLASAYGMSVVTNSEAYIPGFNFCTYQLQPGTDAPALMQRMLDENPADVRLVEYNPIYRALYTPNDPKVQDGTQWCHDASHSDDYGAWEVNKGGDPGVYIAILDTGVDLDHPDLAANVLPVNTMWPDEDFDLSNGASDLNPQDENGHGTHCAGIAAAVGNNDTGGCGVAYNCSILPIKLANAAGQFVGSTPTAIALANACGAKVISMSFGGYLPSETLKQACEVAYNDGMLLVAAAGNDNNSSQTHFPAGIPVVIAVGATDGSNNTPPS
jgi:subtilisin family serine protease